MKQEVFRTSRIERWGFALFMAGQGIVNTFVGGYLQLYLTDIGITAVVVGVMFLIARVWDAVNDPIFGAILDKLNLKGGKFLPFLRASNIMLPLTVILLFAVPGNMPVGMKVAWSFVAYLLYDVAYTMCDVPVFAMTSAVTDQVHERIGIMSRNTVLSAIAMPLLTKRFDKFHLLMVGVIGQTVMNVICFFAGYENVGVFLVLMLIRCIFFAFQLVLQLQFTGDFVEYGEYITGKRLQGTAYSIQTFVFKFMNAVPGALAMILLGVFGFVSGEGAVQPASAISAIWVLFMLSPVAGAVISIPIFSRYKLRDEIVQIMAAANSGDITRKEAEEKLAGKY